MKINSKFRRLPILPFNTVVAFVLLLLASFIVARVTSLSLRNNNNSNNLSSRREVLSTTAGSIGIAVAGAGSNGLFLPPDVALATTDDDDNVQKQRKPIAVIGASGRTGSLCVSSCLRRNVPVRALTRTGTWQPNDYDDDDVSVNYSNNNNNLLSVQSCDVRDPESIASSIADCSCVIYAASASKYGGNPKQIDNDGVVQTGLECLKQNIGQYIVISSTATTRPKSLGYIFTDVTVNGIMTEKKKGEDAVIDAYNNNKYNNNDDNTKSSSSSSYIIVRPGGLEEPKKNIILGPSALEISQGDVYAGIISRADLAEVIVELALLSTSSSSSSSNNHHLKNTALELYYTDSVQPCEGKFKSLLKENKIPRLHGNTYDELFRNIQPNGAYYIPA